MRVRSEPNRILALAERQARSRTNSTAALLYMERNSKARLLISTSGFWPLQTGISKVCQELLSRLANWGYGVTVATPRLAGQSDEDQWGQIKVIRVDAKGRGTLTSKYSGDIARYRRVLRDQDADIYLFVCWENWLVDTAVPIFVELRGKKVMASHGTSVFWRPPGFKGWGRRILWQTHKWRYQQHLPKFDYFVLLTGLVEKTRFYDKLLLDRLGYTNFAIVPNGTNGNLFVGRGETFRSQFQLNGQFLVLYVANYQWQKNQEALIRAFYQAKLDSAALVLIGSEMNDYARSLQQKYVCGAKKSERLLLLANQTEEAIRDAYCAADLFVCTSLTEAQPLVILDAMAAGTPFLSRDVGGVAELPGGVVVKNERELVHHIQWLAQDEKARIRLGAAGRQACIDKYDWDRSAREYASIFDHLLADKR